MCCRQVAIAKMVQFLYWLPLRPSVRQCELLTEPDKLLIGAR